MIPLTNYDFQWGRSEVVIIYPDYYSFLVGGFNPSEKYESQLGWLFRFPIYGKTKNVPNHQSDYILEFLFLTIMFYPNPHDCLWFLSKCLPNVPIVDVFFPNPHYIPVVLHQLSIELPIVHGWISVLLGQRSPCVLPNSSLDSLVFGIPGTAATNSFRTLTSLTSPIDKP